MAFDLSIAELNRGLTSMSTQVQCSAISIATMVENCWDRMKPELEARGWGVSQLAKELKITYQAVKKVRDGGSFNSENNLKAAAVLGLNPTWLALGKGPKQAGQNASPKGESTEASVTPIERAASSPYSVVKSLAAMLSALGVDERKYAGAILEELVKNPDDAERIAKLGRWLGGSDDQQNEANEAIHRRTQP